MRDLDLRERLRDPWGWTLDKTPWPLRRLVFAWRFKEWPWRIPNGARYLRCRRPPREAFERGRELARKYGW